MLQIFLIYIHSCRSLKTILKLLPSFPILPPLCAPTRKRKKSVFIETLFSLYLAVQSMYLKSTPMFAYILKMFTSSQTEKSTYQPVSLLIVDLAVVLSSLYKQCHSS